MDSQVNSSPLNSQAVFIESIPLASEENTLESNENLSPEFLQRKLYFLLEHLKKMHCELPE